LKGHSPAASMDGFLNIRNDMFPIAPPKSRQPAVKPAGCCCFSLNHSGRCKIRLFRNHQVQAVSKMQIMLKDKARADEKAQHT